MAEQTEIHPRVVVVDRKLPAQEEAGLCRTLPHWASEMDRRDPAEVFRPGRRSARVEAPAAVAEELEWRWTCLIAKKAGCGRLRNYQIAIGVVAIFPWNGSCHVCCYVAATVIWNGTTTDSEFVDDCVPSDFDLELNK